MCGRLRVGKSFLHVLQHWSVQPCVRPVDAVHMTAGHNALRGSMPPGRYRSSYCRPPTGCTAADMSLFIAQCHDRIEARGPTGRIETEGNSREPCKSTSQDDCPWAD